MLLVGNCDDAAACIRVIDDCDALSYRTIPEACARSASRLAGGGAAGQSSSAAADVRLLPQAPIADLEDPERINVSFKFLCKYLVLLNKFVEHIAVEHHIEASIHASRRPDPTPLPALPSKVDGDPWTRLSPLVTPRPGDNEGVAGRYERAS